MALGMSHSGGRVIGLRYGCALLVVLAGCSSSHYRLRADRDSYSILGEKTSIQPELLPVDFATDPHPASRLADPSCPTHPQLPSPHPRLYAYQIPIDLLDDQAEPVEILVAPPSDSEQQDANVKVTPLIVQAWEEIPPECLARTLEFDSARQEYFRSYNQPPAAELLDSSPRLTLDDVVALGLLNSREYQSQKELLYRVALRLTLERYEYLLKFSTTNNGLDVRYDHTRVGGETINKLSVPSRLQADKVLATGGMLLARFANQVILTFNGPDGFAADIGSELFFNLTQSIFQRDIVFEQLTQAERDVVYAANDFARFRKQIFFDFAANYYSLLRTYRQIEIDTQNYFTLVRARQQAQQEYDEGFLDRVQLEQIEQNALTGRAQLISACNSLETELDGLKFRMGLPTETPINLELEELKELTERDRLGVAGELIRRAVQSLQSELRKQTPDRGVLLSSAILLIDRMVEAGDLRRQLGEASLLTREFQLLKLQLLEERTLLDVRRKRVKLAEEQVFTPPSPPLRIFQRTIELIRTLSQLSEHQLALASQAQENPAEIERMRQRLANLDSLTVALRQGVASLISEAEPERIPELVSDAEELLLQVEQLADEAGQRAGRQPERDIKNRRQYTLDLVRPLLERGAEVVEMAESTLVAVEVDLDDAMFTALVGRLDLMNVRGLLTDERRRIKLSEDDLKSVLNLNASQLIRTPLDLNRPFSFTFDNSETLLRANFDLPLNRRVQRNAFREQLLNYQLARRNLMQLEDSIKLDVRNDLRTLRFTKNQYQISVASAALAFERVNSTRLELQLGFPNIAARDFLEAQDAYIQALSAVADNRINHIVARTQLFLNLELMDVGQSGFWDGIYDQDQQPIPSYELSPNAVRTYGELPHGVLFSRALRHALWFPLVPCWSADPINDVEPTGEEIARPAEELPTLVEY